MSWPGEYHAAASGRHAHGDPLVPDLWRGPSFRERLQGAWTGSRQSMTYPTNSGLNKSSTYCAFFAQETRSWMPIPAHDGSSVHVLTIRNEQICRVSSRCDAVDMRIVSMHGRHSTRQMEPRKDAIQITAERHAMRIARADPNGEIESSALSALFIISSCFACLEFRVTLSSARRDDRFASRRRPWNPSPRHCSARCLPRRHPDSSTRRTVISSAWPSSWVWSLCVDATLRRPFLRDGRDYCAVCGTLTGH